MPFVACICKFPWHIIASIVIAMILLTLFQLRQFMPVTFVEKHCIAQRIFQFIQLKSVFFFKMPVVIYVKWRFKVKFKVKTIFLCTII